MDSSEEKEHSDGSHGMVIARPNLEFEEGTHSIFMIIRRFPFPVVVLCDTTKCPIPVDRAKFSFDLSQPLLFYRKRNINKIPARALCVDDNDEYKAVGDPLLIPEDYKGYFAILKRRNFKGPADESAPHFSKIEDVALSDTEEFLIGGQNRVKGIHVTGRNEDIQSSQERMLFPGDVLRKIKIFTRDSKRKSKILRRSSLVVEKFLLCMDEADREILIPFIQTGLFYALSTTSGKGTCPVMQMSEIVANRYMPCVVKLVYGRVPSTPCFFSGLLQLEPAYLEQSIVAATLMNYKNILVEIPSGCKMEFRVAHTNDELLSNPGYQSAMKLCTEKVHSYMRNMKVCHSWKSESSVERPESGGSITAGERVSTLSQDEDTPAQLPKPCLKDINRDSGYMKMSPSADDMLAQKDRRLDHQNNDSYVKMNQPALSPPDYVLKLFLENKFLEVPVYSQDTSQSCNPEIDTRERHEHITTPPDLPPPPIPCSGTPPSLSGGSPSQDSGISDIGLSDIRRPSTFIFAEDEQNQDDEKTYDIPQIPTRRVSAPPNLDLLPTITDDTLVETKPTQCNRRQNVALSRVTSAPSEMTSNDGKLLSPSEVIYELDHHCENPRYENVQGMKEIQAQLIEFKSLTESIITGDDPALSCFPWHQTASDSNDELVPPSCHSPKMADEPALPSPCLSKSSSISPPNHLSDDSARSSSPCRNPQLLPSPSQCISNVQNNICDIPSIPVRDTYKTLPDGFEDCNIYDEIPDIPGVDSSEAPPTPHPMVVILNKAYVKNINSDIVECQKPPSPHQMKPTEKLSAENKTNDNVTEVVEVSRTVDISNNGDTDTKTSDMVGNATGDCEKMRCEDLSENAVAMKPSCEVSLNNNKCPSGEMDSSDLDNVLNPNTDNNESIAYLEREQSTQSDCHISSDVHEVRTAGDVEELSRGQSCCKNKYLRENELQIQVSEQKSHCESGNQSQVSQMGESNNSDLCEMDSAVISQSSQNDQCLKTVKQTKSHPPPPISPKPLRSNSERKCSLSEQTCINTSKNVDSAGEAEHVKDEQVFHQLRHRERSESNSISMSPERFDKALEEVGVTPKSRQYIADQGLTIQDLIAMDVEDLNKHLPGVGFLDLKRVAFLIRNVLAGSSNSLKCEMLY